MRYLTTTLLLMLALMGQAQKLLWEKTYGSFLLYPSTIEAFDYYDGHYALSFTGGYTTPYLGSMGLANAKGDTVWTRKFADAPNDNFKNPIKFLNGKIYYMPFRLVNNTIDTIENVLKKIDINGDTTTLWKGLFMDFLGPFQRDILVVDENHLWFLGKGNNSKIPGNKGGGGKFTLMGFDTLGTNTIQRYYNKTDTTGINIDPSSIIRYGANNFAMYGRGNPAGQIWNYIMKIRPNGDTIASSLLFDSGDIDIRGWSPNWGNMIYGTDEHFYISGSDRISKPKRNVQPYLAKVDTSLNPIWFRYLTLGEDGVRIHQLPDGNLLAVGAGYNPAYISLHKLSQDGELLDSAQVPTQIDTKCNTWYSMFHPEDSTLSYAGALNGNAYLARIDLKKFVVTGLNKEEEQVKDEFSISPNPSNGFLQVHGWQLGNLEIYDTQGALMKKQKIDSPNQQINIQDLNSGTYLYRFSTENGVRYGTIVKQ